MHSRFYDQLPFLKSIDLTPVCAAKETWILEKEYERNKEMRMMPKKKMVDRFHDSWSRITDPHEVEGHPGHESANQAICTPGNINW